jgi:prepilin-type N-terminal cleavage/methylation domain-containing protein
MERPSTVPSVSPKNPSSARRSGFTLVELLAVIMIIALLAGLVTPAVMRAMSSARTAAVKAEIDLLHMALVNYKNEYGSFPPADMRGLWKGSAVDPSHPAYKHLQRIFPRITENKFLNEGGPGTGESPYMFMAQMSPAQALVFWLQGFYDNPQYPLTNKIPLNNANPRSGDSAGSRKKLFDFDDSRLVGASAYFDNPSTATSLPLASQTFMTRNNSSILPFARDYPVYFPKQPNTGLPYVYFPASTYSSVPLGSWSVSATLPPSSTTWVLYYDAVSTTGGVSKVSPYVYSSPPSQPSWAQLHANADSFQLIAAGADGTYGQAIAAFPGNIVQQTLNPAGPQYGQFWSVTDEINAPGHADNITNFANGPLKEAAAKLLNP